MKHYIKKIASVIHFWYNRVHTFWRVRETNISFCESLDYNERGFFLEFLPALAGENLVVYDIGAASGVVSRCFAKLPNVHTIQAFEPISSAFVELTEHTRQYPKITRHNVALGDENCDMNIHVIGGSRDSSSLLIMKQLHKKEFPKVSYQDHLEKVRVVRLDDFVRDNDLPLPHVVKIDVQGYEDRVLCGGRDTIGQSEFCILEISLAPLYENSPLFDDIYNQMRGMGFRLIGIGGSLRGISGGYLQLDGIFQNEFTT